jgi:integrase
MKNEIKGNLISDLQPWIEQFILSIPHLGENTRREYRKNIHLLITHLDKSSNGKGIPTAVKLNTITEWIKEMLTRNTLLTILSRVHIIDRFLSFLEDKGVLGENPLSRVQKLYPRKGLKGIILAMETSSPQESLQALKSPDRFTSPLGRYMQEFIALGQAQGKKYWNEAEMLGRFDRFLMTYAQPPQQLSESVVNEWLGLFSPRTRYTAFGTVRTFCHYLRRFSPQAYVPDSSLVPPPPASLPYIYSRAEVVALLRAARQLKSSSISPYRPQTFYTLILLLYTTGMRIGEALRLQFGDIDHENQLLHIRETKFFKSRLVPLSPSMMRELEAYLQLRRQFETPITAQSSLFQNPHRRSHYAKSTVWQTFSEILKSIGIKKTQGRRGPCIHGLRHTMATHRLEDWYRQGESVQSKLGLLSTYLGHVNITATQRYLTMTTELLQQASQRFNQYFTPTKAIFYPHKRRGRG